MCWMPIKIGLNNHPLGQRIGVARLYYVEGV